MTALSSSEQLQLSATIKRQALIWLAVSLTLSGIFIILWLYGNSIATESDSNVNAIEKSVASVKAVHLSERISKLNDLSDDVKPIEFKTVVRDMRDYPPEFKDKIFINKNKGKWTLQVMNVSEHDIIRDYLNSRDDRDKFAYFRYSDKNNKSRYILTYDVVASLDEATILASEIDFTLPKNVKVEPEEIKRYASMIDSYERSEAVLDMSRNRPRSIILKETSHIVPFPVKKVVKERPQVDTSYSSKVNSYSPKVKNNYSYRKPATRSVPKSKSNSSYTTSAPVQTKQQKYSAPVKNKPTKIITKSLGDEQTVSLGSEPMVTHKPAPQSKPKVQPAQPKLTLNSAPKEVATPKPMVNTQKSYSIREDKQKIYNLGDDGSQPQSQPQAKQFVPNSAPE